MKDLKERYMANIITSCRYCICSGLHDKNITCFGNSYMALYMDRCDCNYKSFQYNFRIYCSKEICSKTYHYE